MTVITGLAHLQAEQFDLLKGKRVGLLTNASAVDQDLNSAYRILASDPVVNLRTLFAPEHGFVGSAPDAERIDSVTDSRTGLQINSLYAEHYRPTPAMLNDLDVLVCDIQDVGLRFYTYAWTVSHILEAAGEQGLEVVILDRPNPLGGVRIEGPLLESHFASFVGRFPVPIRHGLTLGELSNMVNATWNPTPCELTIVPCQDWRRAMNWGQTGLPWVPPSPNLPHYETLLQYPGACLVEGTTLSEGRGTSLPFEVVGAPWIDPVELAEHLNAQPWASQYGARFRPHTFLPDSSKWRGRYCHGIQTHIVRPDRWDALRVWLYVIVAIRHLYPEDFAWLPPASEGVEVGAVHHFDRLIGSDVLRQQIEAGAALKTLTQGWEEACQSFENERQPFLLYD